jgi:hypothetical protein
MLQRNWLPQVTEVLILGKDLLRESVVRARMPRWTACSAAPFTVNEDGRNE